MNIPVAEQRWIISTSGPVGRPDTAPHTSIKIQLMQKFVCKLPFSSLGSPHRSKSPAEILYNESIEEIPHVK